MDRHLLKSELALYGIRVDGDTCRYFRAGKETTSTSTELCEYLRSAIIHNQKLLKTLWDEMMGNCRVIPTALYSGTDSSQRLFVHSVKQIWRFAKANPQLMNDKPAIREMLRRDINTFSESFMSNLIEYSLCINWIKRVIRYEDHRLWLIHQISPQNKQASGQYGDINLRDDERVYPYWMAEEEDKEYAQDPNSDWAGFHRRYTAFRDQDWSEGFLTEDDVFRRRMSPYFYTNQEENPNRKSELARQG